jgi:hypothetical protein
MKSPRPVLIAMAVSLTACASIGSTPDGAPPAVTGTWQGKIEFSDQPVEVTLQIGVDRQGTMDMAARSLRQIAVALRSDPASRQFVVSSQDPPATFIGVRAGAEVSGTYHEAHKQYPFRLKRGG